VAAVFVWCYTCVLVPHFLMKRLLPLFALFVLSACVPPTTLDENDDARMEQADNMMIEDADPSNDDDDMIEDENSSMESATYAVFTPAVLTDGQPKVLFFHAAWCPVCKEADTKLTAWFENEMPTIDVYKLNYDTETSLRSKYGVTYQHTFVLVDGEGNEVQVIQGPSDAALKALIGA